MTEVVIAGIGQSPVRELWDLSIRELAYGGWRPKPLDLVPRDARFDDRALVTADVGSYKPNVWGLCDTHGNAAEWTRTAYAPYPYVEADGRNNTSPADRRVVRGHGQEGRRLPVPQFRRTLLSRRV